MQTITFNNPKEEFVKAIKEKRLSLKPVDSFAGHYMYMGQDENNKAMFKNINTRKYDV